MRALSTQDNELATILDNVPFIMLLVDGERRIRRVNDYACSFAGSASGTATGQRLGEFLHCAHSLDVPAGCGFGRECQNCAIRRSVAETRHTGRSRHQVEKIMAVAGQNREQRVIFLLSTNRVAMKNEPLVLLSLQDITDRRRLADQLRQAQKMESIGTLAGGIAHDFNNILTVIMGYAQMTLMRMPQGDPLRGNIEQIMAAGERASGLTKDLLLFGRKQVTDRRLTDLNDIIRGVEHFLTRMIGEDITCTTHLAEGPLPVFADAHHLEQVLMNLAANARDAMPDGGTFTITTGSFRCDDAFVAAHGYGTPGMYCVVSVADTGLGMDDYTREHIFEPFFTTKEVGKGTGLGMAVAYGIIRQHDGYIDISSEPGLGTTLRIYLPITESVKA